MLTKQSFLSIEENIKTFSLLLLVLNVFGRALKSGLCLVDRKTRTKRHLKAAEFLLVYFKTANEF